jgi:hypothetical protein
MPPADGKNARQGSYLLATRHPWPCLLFLLPLLLGYEVGVVWLGGAHGDTLRNGVDAWLRWALDAFGMRQLYWPPAFIGAVFLLWSWRRRADRPEDLLGVLTGMGLESVVFALGLWGISQGLVPLLTQIGPLSSHPATDDGVGQVVTFVGAGIYEEVLFRLVLFSVLRRLIVLFQTPWPTATALAAAGSAALFSAAHHVGPYGEPFEGKVFVFRLVAGLYFALLFQMRGFGVAVGAHAIYDVLVGVSVG